MAAISGGISKDFADGKRKGNLNTTLEEEIHGQTCWES